MSISDTAHCCLSCRAPCNNDFKQIVNLKDSGLVIYVDNKANVRCKNITSIVLQNMGEKESRQMNYVTELCMYKTKCIQCQKIIQFIRCLLDNIEIIRRNEVLAVCNHCKANIKIKCTRCDYMLKKFFSSKLQQHESFKDELTGWRQMVKDTVSKIIDQKNTCPHRVTFLRNSDMELRKLINLLKIPSKTAQPRVDTYPPGKIDIPVPINEDTEQVLLEVIDEVRQTKVPSSDAASIASTCMCKYFDERKKERIKEGLGSKTSQELLIMKENELASSDNSDFSKFAVSAMSDKVGDTKKFGNQNKRHVRGDIKSEIKKGGKKGLKEIRTKDVEFNKNAKDKKYKIDPEYELMLQLIKIHKEEVKVKSERTKSALRILKNMPKIPDLPELPVRPRRLRKSEDISEISGSTLVCTPHDILPRVMIRGKRVVPLDLRLKSKAPVLKPIIFNRQLECNTPSEESSNTSLSVTIPQETDKKIDSNKGIIKYALSKKEFIDKGWTKLPTTKVMRRMNIYKMEPANPHFDWFKSHSQKRIMFYNSGEILAEINEKGCGGRWYYKNGSVALDFLNSQTDVKDKFTYIIYDLNEGNFIELKNTRRPKTILACFDYLGNGVVFDPSGKARLKYNQSEGIVIDEKIGSPSKWKWHTLNDPPILQNVYIDNEVRDPSLLQEIITSDSIGINNENSPKHVDEEMLTIEFENFVKEKAEKILQKMKSFKIRIKALKINNYFSLRIIDQTNIYILFRNGNISFKLNIGMLLKSNEIVDTINVKLGEVSTPYDGVSETKGVSDILEIIRSVHNFSGLNR